MIKAENFFSINDVTQSSRRIHTPSAFAKKNLLYVQEVGYLQSLSPHKCIRENLDSFLFLMVLEGKGCIDVRNLHYDISVGDCVLIDCKDHYEHISDKKEAWKLAWVHFNGHIARSYYDLFIRANNEKNTFVIKDIKCWDDMINNLLNIPEEKNFQAELKCGEILLHLLNSIINNVSDTTIESNDEEKQMAEDIRKMLNEQYADMEVLEKVKTDFPEDLQTLRRNFEKQFGISLEEYINNRRFNSAKELLRFSIKPIEFVAEESGIGDIKTMQQLFCKHEGMTAEEYRAKWAQWIR